MANSGRSAATTRPPSKGRSLQEQFAALLAAPPPGAKAAEPEAIPVKRDVLADGGGAANDRVDSGEPVDVPPPLVEMVGFDEPELPRSDPPVTPPPAAPPPVIAPPTPRRSFLAQLRTLRPSMSPRKATPAEPGETSGLTLADAAAKPGRRAALHGQLPPLRHFLAPLRALQPQRSPHVPDASPLVLREPPVAAPAVPPAAPSASPAAPPALAAVPLAAAAEPGDKAEPQRVRLQLPPQLRTAVEQWRGALQAKLGERQQLAYWGRWAAVAVVVLIIVGVAGPRLLHRSPPHSLAPIANAPSDPAARFAYFKRGADAGDPEAELQLAILYAKGEGVAQDYATAATWFRAAAEQGLPRAQYDLGVLYDRGRGVTADPTQATNWYRKAAEGKYPLAQYNLAVAYTKGDGIRKDVAEAALWYRRAAGQGVVQAMVNLGMLYERGEGVPVSQVDAYAWYLAAGKRGNQPAARRADDLFGGFSQLEQVRAQVLAGDVAGSIHDPAAETPGGG